MSELSDFIDTLKRERTALKTMYADQIFAPEIDHEGARMLHGIYLQILQDGINTLRSIIEFLETQEEEKPAGDEQP